MAAAKKTTKKTQPAPKIKRIKKTSLNFSKIKPNLNLKPLWENYKQSLAKHPSLFTLGAVVIVVIVALGLLFIFRRGIFLAGSVDGHLVTTPSFYSELVKAHGSEVFDNITRDTLIQQEADKKKLTVSSKEVDDRINTIQDNLGGKDALQSALSQNNTTMDELKTEIRYQLLAEKLLAKDITVSDAEVAKYMADNKAAVAGLTKAQVADQLKSQKFNDKFTSWYDTIKKNAHISKYF